MQEKSHSPISPYADLMGRVIGQLRDHQGLTLKQLSKGLCGGSFLNKIENGSREAGKLLTDAFFQRLGKPVELFERILDHEEFVKWTQRQEIIRCLRGGNIGKARECAGNYREDKTCVLDRQFLAIVEINCLALEGMAAEELLPLVTSALRLTRPDFGKVPLEKLLLSQNEGRLLFAHLQLREKLEGSAAVAEEFRALARYFKHPRYESRERVYLFPYVACRVVENDYREGKYAAALAVCEDALSELTQEKRLFAYDRLLAWKQKLFDAMGNPDRTPERLLEELQKLLERAPERADLLVPCEEQGHVYCLNQVIRSRRALLGFSQEELSDDACGLRSLSRIENEDRKIQRKNRKLLLRKVNMSGERYDYEIISERYEDYLLRSEIDRAIVAKDVDRATALLRLMRERLPWIPTNQQYLIKKELDIGLIGVDNPRNVVSLEKRKKKLRNAIQLTLPLDFNRIEKWPIGVLTVNEQLSLMVYAMWEKQSGKKENCLDILQYIRNCLRSSKASVSYYEDMYTRLGVAIAVILHDLKRYEASVAVLQECLELSVEAYNGRRLARYAYVIAYNLESQSLIEPDKDRRNEAISWLRQAHIISQILNDRSGQRYIEKYVGEKYGGML